MKKLILPLLICIVFTSNAQIFQGFVKNKKTNKGIDFVNIGVVGKNSGTVSKEDGYFSLFLDSSVKKSDIIRVSRIGFEPIQILVSELNSNQVFEIEEKPKLLAEVRIKPRIFKEKTLGNTFTSKKIIVGWSDNTLGKEFGVKMKVKKTAFLKEVKINISKCLYDTIFYRLNIVEIGKDDIITNILTEPIYLVLPKESIKETIIINLRDKNIVTDGNFIVSLEHVKDLGKGGLYFCSAFFHKTYVRLTSQGNWETAPLGTSISVLADVEQ